MKKWGYLVLAVGWTLSMVYEALFVPALSGAYALMAGILDLVFVVLYAWELRKERRQGKAEKVTKGVYVTVAVLLCVLLGLAISKSSQVQPPHVMFLPLYLVAIVGAVGAAIWLWRERKETGVFRERSLGFPFPKGRMTRLPQVSGGRLPGS